jgi:DNA-directed RNA polymerase subunit RPC12/RpoP
MANGIWHIEQGCPQCGAPVTLDETDRLLACPFCRTRLYLAPEEHFDYYIPPAVAADGELFYVPYWRLRGSSFSVTASGVTHRFVDTNTLAVAMPGLPGSLGLRPQVLKLRFALPATDGRFIAPDLPAARAAPDRGAASPDAFYHEFIGETLSVIHSPVFLRGDTLTDAILGRPVPGWTAATRNRLLGTPAAALKEIRFVPTLCPRCGWDMEGERDSLVLICRNCSSAWTCPKDAFIPVEFTVMAPPPETEEIAIYLPFWRMKPRIEGMELATYADLIRIANLPKAIIPAYSALPLRFWSPAFKINPSLYSRWARQMTIFQPAGSEGDQLPKTPLYPVTLPLREAAEAIVITLAEMLTDKRRLYPRLSGLGVTLDESRLEYHPFLLEGNDLLHASLRVALDRTALAYGIRL